MKTLALTGHRPKDLGGYDENNLTAQTVKAYLKKLLTFACQTEYTTFIIGMAQGIDQWAGEILIDLKKQYPDIKIIAAVPFAQQAKAWPGESGWQRWLSILQGCDEIHLTDIFKQVTIEELCDLANEPNLSPKYVISKKLNDRNKWMVDRADSILAVWKGTSGGTGNCVQYALSKNKNIYVYDPNTNSVSKYNVA